MNGEARVLLKIVMNCLIPRPLYRGDTKPSPLGVCADERVTYQRRSNADIDNAQGKS